VNAEKTASKKNWIDGKSILGAPAAKLRKTLAVASSRRRDVQGITRRIEERTALAGRRWVGLISGSAIAFAFGESALAGAGERRECLVLVPLVRCFLA
jgi:hypothetical protein